MKWIFPIVFLVKIGWLLFVFFFVWSKVSLYFSISLFQNFVHQTEYPKDSDGKEIKKQDFNQVEPNIMETQMSTRKCK